MSSKDKVTLLTVEAKLSNLVPGYGYDCKKCGVRIVKTDDKNIPIEPRLYMVRRCNLINTGNLIDTRPDITCLLKEKKSRPLPISVDGMFSYPQEELS